MKRGEHEERRLRARRNRVAALLAVLLPWAGTQNDSLRAAAPIRRNPPGVSDETVAAIDRGLKFLVSRQRSDGSFRDQNERSPYPVAMTSLAGLALVSSGSTPTEGQYAPSVRRALSFVLGSAQRNGLICRTGEEESRSMYGHGFGMLMLAQMMGMEEDPQRLERIHFVLRNGAKLTAQAQSALGGWLYTPDMNGDEGSVTVTQVQALRAARNAGVSVPKDVIDKAMRYLEKSVQPDGGIAYRVGMTGSRPPITAAAVACWFNAGEYDNPLALNALAFCKRQIRVSDGSGTWGHWYYAHLYLSQVMYLVGKDDWTNYYAEIRDRLLATQRSDGAWEGDSVGQVYGTSIALIVLQLPYNNLPIMQR